MFSESSNWLLPFVLLGVILLLWLLVPLAEQEMVSMVSSEACWHLGWILPLVVRMALLRM